MRVTSTRNAIFIGLLAAAAAFWNLHAPTVFFDSQIMLGGSLAIFALLQFGWPGLAVGITALAATAIRWGHPFELLIGTTFLVWLKIFLDRFNGGWNNRDNGRVVLAALGFWLVAGIALEVLLFNRVFGIAAAKALGLGLKEGVTALVNTTLGFLAYLAVRWWQPRSAQSSLSARGLVFAALLAAITIPGVGLSMTLSGQLRRSVLERYLDDLKHFGMMSAAGAAHGTTDHDGDSGWQHGDMAFLVRRGDGTVTTSDPALFERLARDFEIESPSRTRLPGLDILKPKAGGPVIATDDQSYWLAEFTAPDPAAANAILDMTVVQTTPQMIQAIDYELLLPSFALLFAIMSLGALASEALGLAVDRQFKSVIGPLRRNAPDGPMPDLGSSRLRELDTIVAAVNERSHRVNELSCSLHRTHLAEKRSKEEITKLIDGLPLAVTINSIEPNPKLTFLNEQFVRTFGYTKEDIPDVGEWAVRAYPDEGYRREVFKKWDTAVARALEAKGLVESIETRVTCKDGTVRDTLINAVVLEDKLVVGLLDISERKRVEEELRESEARFRVMADAAPVLIWVTGTGQGCTWFNRFWLDFTGRTMEQELGDGWTEGVHPDDRKRCLDIYTDHFRRRAPFSMDYRLRRHDGEYRWLVDNGVPRFDGEGNFAGFIGSCVDITDRKLAEEQLRQSEEQLRKSEADYRALIENSPVGIFGTDSDGRITLFNPSMLRILGVDSAEGEFAQRFYANPQDRAEFVRRLRKDRKVEHFEVPLRHLDGRVIWADYNARIASGDPDGKFTIQGFFTDITARKVAEEKLRESEERYRSFFNLPLVGTAITARRKGWLEVNDATCRILGYTREELFSKTWAEITHPDDIAKDNEQFTRMLNREIDGYTLEKRFIRKDGSVVHTILSGGCGDIGDAAPEVFYVNILDISARKKLEEDLRLSEERHRLLADNAADVINVIDLSGRLVYVSPSVERLIGYTQEEALKLSVEDILVPEAAAGARAGLAATAAAIAAGGPLPEFHGEFPHRHKDGSTVWAEATSTCMLDKEGKYVGTLVVTRDIRERKRLEEELRHSEERYRLLADNSADVIWLLDLPTMSFIYVSPAVEKLRGFTVEEVLRQEPKDAMTPESYRILEERLPGRLAAFAAGDEAARAQTHEIMQTRKDGGFVPTEVTTTLLSDADGQVRRLLGISRDITERKAIEAELAAAREREKQAEEHARHTLERKLKSSLAASAVAHEINQPLSRILLKARMTLEQSSEARDTLQPIIADAERVVTTIEKMRVLLRNVETKHHPVDLAQVVRSSLFQIKQLLLRGKIRVNYAKPAEECMIRGDDVQLQMAVTNLLRNAVDAIVHHGGDKHEIAIDLIPTPGTVALVVGDSGPGWQGGTLDEVLLNTSKPAGAGIGLFIVKTTVEHHRGTIEVGRSPLGGAEFRLTFGRVTQDYPAEGTR